jgi:hypothetical protein
MTTTSTSPSAVASAKILTFPPRGRFANSQRDQFRPLVAQPATAAKIASGSAWYHEAAIQDAERGGKS